MRGIEYRTKNPEKVRESSKKWRNNNIENYKKTIEKYLEKNPHMVSKERLRIYRQDEEFREKANTKKKEYYRNNIEQEREKGKKYYHKNKQLMRKKK